MKDLKITLNKISFWKNKDDFYISYIYSILEYKDYDNRLI